MSEPDNMIDRVAGAIRISLDGSLDDEQRAAIDFNSLTCKHMARAAIDAMRASTKAMQEAGVVCIYGDQEIDDDLRQEMQWAFAVMIDAALAQSPNHPHGEST